MVLELEKENKAAAEASKIWKCKYAQIIKLSARIFDCTPLLYAELEYREKCRVQYRIKHDDRF